MSHTERELLLAEREVSTLEHFMAEQKFFLSRLPMSIEQKAEGERLIAQFEEALKRARRRYRDMLLAAHQEDVDKSEQEVPPSSRKAS